MTAVTAAELIAAPRGRALCLHVAQGAAPALREAMFWAVWARRSANSSASLVSVTASGDPEPPPPPLDDAQLAAMVAAIPDAAISSQLGHLTSAFAHAVDAAYYWQEPDEAEQLAAEPHLAAALMRVADAVVASPAFEEWAAPAASAQWRVDFDQAHPREVPDNARAVLARWRDAVRAEEIQALAERPVDPEANWSGSWWSIPPRRLAETTGSDADAEPRGLGLVEDRLGWTAATVTPVRGSGRVLELDEESWVRLCREHPMVVTASRRHDWFRATGRSGTWVIPDWAAVAAEWDAVHLSIAQYLVLAGRALEVGDGVASLVAGWDPDRTVWFTPVSVRGEPQRWVCDEPGTADAPWRRV